MNTDLKTQIIQRVTPDLEQVEQALKQNLSPHLDLVKKSLLIFCSAVASGCGPFCLSMRPGCAGTGADRKRCSPPCLNTCMPLLCSMMTW